MLEDNKKENPDKSYTNNHQKHVACSYGYKLVFVGDKVSKLFNSYLGEDAVYKFINSVIKESKCCNHVTKKHFKKELVMTKTEDEDFENSAKFWIYDNVYVEGDVKVRVCCLITVKYRRFAHRDCNIKVNLNHKTLIVFHNLKNYDSQLALQ